MTKEDGKIRIRCTGCGKRVKFPAGNPGKAFRCPICHTVIVAPIGDADAAPSSPAERRTAIPKRSRLRPSLGDEPDEQKDISVAAPSEDQPLPSPIDRVTSFLNRENQRIAHFCKQILSDPTLAPAERAEQIKKLRHTKALHLRDFVQTLLKDLDERIKKLMEHPASETESIRSKLDALMAERKGFLLYLNIMFQYRTVAQDDAARKGIPST